MHEREHELRVLVARDELGYLLQDVLTLVEALREQRVGPLVGDEPQVADGQVDQLVHQVHVQHGLIAHVQVQLDLAQGLDVQFQSLTQALEPLAASGFTLFAQAGFDPTDLHCAAIDIVVHLLEELELLLHLHQVVLSALLHPCERGVVHGQHVGLVLLDRFLEYLATGFLVALQECDEAQLHHQVRVLRNLDCFFQQSPAALQHVLVAPACARKCFD